MLTAYKGLLKEKEALGATVKALSEAQIATSKDASVPRRDPTDGGAASEVWHNFYYCFYFHKFPV